MKVIKKILISLIIVLISIIVLPQIIPTTQLSNLVQASNIRINITETTLSIGDAVKLKIKGTSKAAKWFTSDAKIVTINENGKVKAKKEGKVIITAKVGSQKFKCKIYVKTPKISATFVNLQVGDYTKLKIKGTSNIVKWFTSDAKVATINDNGKLKAKKAGKAIITAKVGSQKLKCKVIVKNKDITIGDRNALEKAKIYLDIMAFSKQGLKEQLEFDGFASSEIEYAINNCNANWNEQAVKKAKNYLDILAFSKKQLEEQLLFDGFEKSQVNYAMKIVWG